MEKKLLIDVMTFEPLKQSLTEALTGMESGKPFTVKGILQRAESKNQNGRIYPFETLYREAQKYNDSFIRERRALGELDHPDCVSHCDIMTYNGWKDIKNIANDERVYTLNRITNQIEVHRINKKIDQYYKGTMYRIKGKNIDIEATPNHRFLVKNRKGESLFITAEELYELSKKMLVAHLTIPKTGEWTGNDFENNEFIIPPVELEYGSFENRDKQKTPLKLNVKAWFQFLGFYLAEGHCKNDNGYEIFISQNEGDIANEFRKILTNLSSELKWNENIQENKENKHIKFNTSDARLWTYLSKLGDKYTKYIPQEIKDANPALLEELFEWFLNGDGTTVNDNGYDRQSIFSVSKKLVEDLQEILVKTGGSGRIKIQESAKDYMFADHLIKVENKSPLHRLWIDKSENIHIDFRFLSIEPFEYEGRIYCVSVPNETFYCRNENKCFWSGNSQVVNLKNVSHNVIEMHWENKDLLGTVEVLSTPSGNILKELFKSNIRLGISSRGLGSIKKLSENADQVQDDFELIAFDFVSNPSTMGAFMFPDQQQTLSEGVIHKPVMNKWDRVESIIQNIFLEVG